MVAMALQASSLYLVCGMAVHGLALWAVNLSELKPWASILLSGFVVFSAWQHWRQAGLVHSKSIRGLRLLRELCQPVFSPATQEFPHEYELIANSWVTARIQVLHFRQRDKTVGTARWQSLLRPTLTAVVLPDSCTRSEQKALCRFLRWRFCYQ
ncbi:MAG: hypothetical protein RQ757_11950 [Pseudomonadales bacterium]|nr:hypothetical protein [Pseudomonadales bacterium]